MPSSNVVIPWLRHGPSPRLAISAWARAGSCAGNVPRKPGSRSLIRMHDAFQPIAFLQAAGLPLRVCPTTRLILQNRVFAGKCPAETTLAGLSRFVQELVFTEETGCGTDS